MGEVVELGAMTTLEIPPDKVLSAALKAGLQTVVVVGWDSDDGLYFASSDADGSEVLWLLEKAKVCLLEAE